MWNTCGECSPHSEWLQYVSTERIQKKIQQGCLDIQWALCKKYGLKARERWYKNKVDK